MLSLWYPFLGGYVHVVAVCFGRVGGVRGGLFRCGHGVLGKKSVALERTNTREICATLAHRDLAAKTLGTGPTFRVYPFVVVGVVHSVRVGVAGRSVCAVRVGGHSALTPGGLVDFVDQGQVFPELTNLQGFPIG